MLSASPLQFVPAGLFGATPKVPRSSAGTWSSSQINQDMMVGVRASDAHTCWTHLHSHSAGHRIGRKPVGHVALGCGSGSSHAKQLRNLLHRLTMWPQAKGPEHLHLGSILVPGDNGRTHLLRCVDIAMVMTVPCQASAWLEKHLVREAAVIIVIIIINCPAISLESKCHGKSEKKK